MSQETLFAPAPWAVQDDTTIIYDANGYCIAALDFPFSTVAEWLNEHQEATRPVPNSEVEATARLMSASPELLDACRFALSMQLKNHGVFDRSDEINVARLKAAIQKATGEE